MKLAGLKDGLCCGSRSASSLIHSTHTHTTIEHATHIEQKELETPRHTHKIKQVLIFTLNGITIYIPTCIRCKEREGQ